MDLLKRFWNWYWVGKIQNGSTPKRLITILLSLMVLCCLCSFPVSLLTPPKTPTPLAAVPQPVSPTAEVPTPIPASPTPESTPTQAPTEPPAPPPDPVVINGSSSNVVDFDISAFHGVAVAHIRNVGSSNFVVWALNQNNEQVDLLINTIGNYDGFVPVNFLDSENISRFQIQSDGNWQLGFYPLLTIKGSRNVSKGQVYQSNGDDIVFVLDPPAIGGFSTNSTSNFIVHSYEDGKGKMLLVNEIGPYSGTIPFRSGVMAIEVKSSGPWQLDMK